MSANFFRRFRRKQSSDARAERRSQNYESTGSASPYFGDPHATKANWNKPPPKPKGYTRQHGEQVLLTFIRTRLGNRAEALAVRLMNKTPLKDGSEFIYTINQTTEETDLQIISRDLLSGRLYRSGMKLYGGAWCNLLLGDKFATIPSTKQVHELIYTRSSCTCLTCMIRAKRALDAEEDDPSEASSGSALSMQSIYTPENSAMANFVQNWKLPLMKDLQTLALSVESRDLEMGTIVRLNSRSSSKFKFTPDFKSLFCHLAYTGPISHEEVYRKVTTIGVNYYLYNKGKKERKVYLRGQLLRIPIEIGVVKLGARPLRTDELGCHYLVHRKQIVQVYIGEVVLEGNAIGSFIQTGLKFYVGFGEEGGCSALFPNRKLGPPRTLGVNELLLHHNMVEDLQVRMR